MTNYNERLDKILSDHGAEQGEFHYSLKQAITSLIKELVAEAKPGNIHKTSYGLVPKGLEDSATAYDIATQDYEQNLLKELEKTL